MKIDYNKVLEEVSAELNENEEVTLETIEELTGGKGEDEDEQQ